MLMQINKLNVHKEKQRGCPLFDENKHTLTYISNILYMYIYIIYLLETIVSKAWPSSSLFLFMNQPVKIKNRH